MFLKALTAFLALPGVFAGIIPAVLAHIDPWRGSFAVMPGIIIMAIGLSLLLWCVRDFYVAGKGTLAPWDPPKHLVTVGLYRYSRNPMYVSVLTLLCGWGILFTSPLVGTYAFMMAFAFHLRVILYEEPCLARLFGHEWEEYRSKVGRWIGPKKNG